MISKTLNKSTSLLLLLIVSACSSTSNDENATIGGLKVGKSYLAGKDYDESKSDEAKSNNNNATTNQSSFSRLPSLHREDVTFQSEQLAKNFSDTNLVNVTANEMPVKDFIHYIYGELLGVNYLLTPNMGQINQPITLNLKENISQRRLYLLAESILAERGLRLKHNDNIYLISKVNKDSKSSTVVGMGRTVDSIPSGNQRILQVVPVLYGIKTSLKNTIEQLADVSVTIDVKQSALFVTGDHANVTRALELVQLLDSPANRGRYVGIVKLVFSSAELYLQQLSVLLENEGIPNSINTPANKNLVFVPLPQIGAVAVFAANKSLFERVEFWTKQIDKPSEGDVKQYFVFHPKYARAQDIGDSLSPLISAKSKVNAAKTSNVALSNQQDRNNSSGQLAKVNRKTGASNNELTFVVDQRSNALVFYTTGTEYKNIIPLINRLDVLPKQVMLDIMVAEVTLTDNFKFGVKWAIENGLGVSDAIGSTIKSGFDKADIFENGFGMVYDSGKGETITATLLKQDDNIKILSNPSILVRDGVTATLDIGTDIAIVGSTTEGFDQSDRITTTSSYRKTGISLSVTPTINAQGVVIMDIMESISNEANTEATGASGNPNIYERSLTTAVVAESGQTIILGGLIDEKQTIGETKVPGFGDIPVIGNLFKSKADEVTRTELVLMVTPKVINRTDQWGGILSSFEKKLTNLVINE